MSLVEQPDHSGVVPVLKPASAALQAAVRAGNINIADGGKMEILDLSSTSIAEQVGGKPSTTCRRTAV